MKDDAIKMIVSLIFLHQITLGEIEDAYFNESERRERERGGKSVSPSNL